MLKTGLILLICVFVISCQEGEDLLEANGIDINQPDEEVTSPEVESENEEPNGDPNAPPNQTFYFSWRKGVCLDDERNRGYNVDYLGECGDLVGQEIGEVNLKDMLIMGMNVKNANLSSAKLNMRYLVYNEVKFNRHTQFPDRIKRPFTKALKAHKKIKKRLTKRIKKLKRRIKRIRKKIKFWKKRARLIKNTRPKEAKDIAKAIKRRLAKKKQLKSLIKTYRKMRKRHAKRYLRLKKYIRKHNLK